MAKTSFSQRTSFDLYHARDETVNFYTLLLSCIAVAYRNGIKKFWLFAQRVEIDSDARRRTYFILPAIALSDIAVVVPHDLRDFFFEHLIDGTRFLDERGFVLEERKDRRFDGGDGTVEFEVGARLAAELVLRVGGNEEREDRPIDAERRLDDVRNESLFCRLIE